jgi:hypothetical protein
VERNEVCIGFGILAVDVAILDRMIESSERRRAFPCESLRTRQAVLDACTITILNERERARVKACAFTVVLCLISGFGLFHNFVPCHWSDTNLPAALSPRGHDDQPPLQTLRS